MASILLTIQVEVSMIVLKNILIATDFGEAAGVALTYARELARTFGSTLHVLHVIDDLGARIGGFPEYAASLGVERSRIETISNWVNLERVTARPPREHTRPTRFLYAGNLGYSQGFDTLIEACRLVGDDIELEIVGAGNVASEVRSLVDGTTNVRLSPPVTSAEYPDLLASADVHVVLQRGASANANFPSKIASSMASGRPLVAPAFRSAPGPAASESTRRRYATEAAASAATTKDERPAPRKRPAKKREKAS